MVITQMRSVLLFARQFLAALGFLSSLPQHVCLFQWLSLTRHPMPFAQEGSRTDFLKLESTPLMPDPQLPPPEDRDF